MLRAETESRGSPREANAVAVITIFRQAGCEGRYIAEKWPEP